ncbi:MAG: serine--tRNA ligase [Desulfobacterales bacterium]|jgi:seryl-tRNA synthetase|nr:serine--tRNA ligase [Desulfobacterales bacterium]
MLEIKLLREDLLGIETALKHRGNTIDLAGFKQLDESRKNLLQEIEALRHQRNTVSETIATLKKAGKDASILMNETKAVSNKIKELEKAISQTEESLDKILLQLPNIPNESVPIGKDETENTLLRVVGRPPVFDFAPQAHWTIGEKLHVLDFERAARITGARFPLYLGAGARMERALINFMLDLHTTEHGYKEILPPYIVNRTTMTHTGQLPKFEADLFKLDGLDYFLIPTAEVPLTNIHQGEILDQEMLPIYYTAFTPCFRSEAGSYGKDTRGLIRQHQFNKVELVKFVEPESSYAELETLLLNAEEILKRLNLPYRVITLCTGDMGFSAAKTYDIEVWMPAQDVYREISSCSNFESFQARRANIRFRTKGRKGTMLVHTLNGSGLAVGRTVAAILENYQQADGSVVIPTALRPYMGGLERITL